MAPALIFGQNFTGSNQSTGTCCSMLVREGPVLDATIIRMVSLFVRTLCCFRKRGLWSRQGMISSSHLCIKDDGMFRERQNCYHSGATRRWRKLDSCFPLLGSESLDPPAASSLSLNPCHQGRRFLRIVDPGDFFLVALEA